VLSTGLVSLGFDSHLVSFSKRHTDDGASSLGPGALLWPIGRPGGGGTVGVHVHQPVTHALHPSIDDTSSIRTACLLVVMQGGPNSGVSPRFKYTYV